MWKKVSTFISILCISVYGAALIVGVVKFASSLAERRIISEKEFSTLGDIVRNASVLGFSNKDIENELRAAVLRSLTLDAVIVTLPEGQSFAADKPEKRALISNYNNTAFSFNTKWRFYRPALSSQVNTGQSQPFNISAVSSYIDDARLGAILRDTLLLVLFAVITAFVVFMLDILVFNKRESVPIKLKPEQDDAVNDEEGIFDEETDEPKGIYLGLLQKLNEFLVVPSHKKPCELALLCAEWSFGTAPQMGLEPMAKQLAEEAAVFFRNKKISAFKKGQFGVFLLLPDVPLKKALDSAREFHGRVLANTALRPALTSLFIGLSVRGGRDVEAERLTLEAEKACEKAKEDPATPIVAFKADPQKFKSLRRRFALKYLDE